MGTVTLIGGRGDVWHNGKRVRKQEQVLYIIQYSLLIYRLPGRSSLEAFEVARFRLVVPWLEPSK